MTMAIGSTTRVITGTYTEQVQQAIEVLVEMGEAAESANRHALSAWYGSVCQWVRECECEGDGFTLTLPDPHESGEPLTIVQVDSRLALGAGRTLFADRFTEPARPMNPLGPGPGLDHLDG